MSNLNVKFKLVYKMLAMQSALNDEYNYCTIRGILREILSSLSVMKTAGTYYC